MQNLNEEHNKITKQERIFERQLNKLKEDRQRNFEKMGALLNVQKKVSPIYQLHCLNLFQVGDAWKVEMLTLTTEYECELVETQQRHKELMDKRDNLKVNNCEINTSIDVIFARLNCLLGRQRLLSRQSWKVFIVGKYQRWKRS